MLIVNWDKRGYGVVAEVKGYEVGVIYFPYMPHQLRFICQKPIHPTTLYEWFIDHG